MWRTIATAVLASPLGIDATPMMDGRQVLDVEFWGTVSFVDSLVDRTSRAGDPVYALMRIDLSLGWNDTDASEPGGDYGFNPERCRGYCPPLIDTPHTFVKTLGVPTVADGSYDGVTLFNAPDFDRFSIRDWELGPRGNDLPRTHQELTVNVVENSDFIHGTGLLQTFDVRPAQDGRGAAYGSWNLLAGGVSKAFTFVVDRIRATPRVCRP